MLVSNLPTETGSSIPYFRTETCRAKGNGRGRRVGSIIDSGSFEERAFKSSREFWSKQTRTVVVDNGCL